MLGWIKEYYRNKLIKSCQGEVATDFINLSNISSVGFVYDITSQDSITELLEIHNFLKKKGIPFKGLAVESVKNIFPREVASKGEKPRVAIPEELVRKQELSIVPFEKVSWLGAVEESVLREFFSVQSDLFISFNNTDSFTINHILLGYVKSPMRVGMVNSEQVPYSIVMEGKDKSLLPVLAYLNQIFYYLDVIKTV